jgi:hypothetical protein
MKETVIGLVVVAFIALVFFLRYGRSKTISPKRRDSDHQTS